MLSLSFSLILLWCGFCVWHPLVIIDSDGFWCDTRLIFPFIYPFYWFTSAWFWKGKNGNSTWTMAYSDSLFWYSTLVSWHVGLVFTYILYISNFTDNFSIILLKCDVFNCLIFFFFQTRRKSEDSSHSGELPISPFLCCPPWHEKPPLQFLFALPTTISSRLWKSINNNNNKNSVVSTNEVKWQVQ